MTTTMEAKPPRNTPGGAIHGDGHEVGPGIWSVSTSSHGGFWLAPQRITVILVRMPGFEPFAGFPWFEEDVDWAVVAITFPEFFSDEQLRAAYITLSRVEIGSRYQIPAFWLSGDSHEAQTVRVRVAAFSAKINDMWEAGAISCSGKGATVFFRRPRDGSMRQVTLPDYPDKTFYSTDELDAFVALGANASARWAVAVEHYEELGTVDGAGNVYSDADSGL